jgi:myo-inositol-1(or 4)-monophosphatase
MDRADFLKDIIKKIGVFQKQHFQTEIAFDTKKHDLDFVSFVDIESENIFVRELKRLFAKDEVLGEEMYESQKEYNTKSLWIIDPLDGTLMFKRGIPQFGPMICYIQNNEIQLSALYDPIADKLYFADHSGSYCNGKPIHVSDTELLSQAVLLGHKSAYTDLPKSCIRLYFYSAISHFTMVASGKVDAYFTRKSVQMKPWDALPGLFLIKQAGGKIQYDSLLKPGAARCGSPNIFDQLAKKEHM